MVNKKTILQIATGCFLLLILAYLNHFDNGFHFDDSHTIVENVNIRNLNNIPQYFTDPSMFSVSQNHRGLRPIVTTTLAVDYWLAGGLYPWMFQLSTFLWHIGLCIMLYFMYKQLLSKYNNHMWISFIAIFGAGWFGLHTVMAETLNYIISRSDVLSTFFIVASFLTFVAYPEKRKYGFYIVPAILAAFTKETAAVLVILLFFYILLFEKKLSLFDMFQFRNFRNVGRAILTLLPLIVVIAAVQVYTLSVSLSDTSLSYGVNNPLGDYLLTQTYVWLLYFSSFFLPIHLSADTDLNVITDISDVRILIGILFVTILIITIFKTSKRTETRPISMGLIWFAASLLPTSLVPFAEVMNDHRMYFAFVGLTLSVVTTLSLIIVRWQQHFEKKRNLEVLTTVLLFVLCLNAYGAYNRNKVWDNEESLWKDVTEKSPENGRGWMNYGLALMERADYSGAIQAYSRALKTNPYYSLLFINMGIAHAALNDSIKAEENFNKAITLAPGDYQSYVYFARYFLKQGQFEKCRSLAKKAMTLNSDSYMAREILMGAYQELGMWVELGNVARSTLELVPDDVKAAQFLQAANTKKPADAGNDVSDLKGTNLSAGAFINLSLQQYNAGKYEECIKSCNLALQIDPQNADAYNNICAAYNMLTQWDKAKAACERALELNPNHANAPANLKWAETKTQ